MRKICICLILLLLFCGCAAPPAASDGESNALPAVLAPEAPSFAPEPSAETPETTGPVPESFPPPDSEPTQTSGPEQSGPEKPDLPTEPFLPEETIQKPGQTEPQPVRRPKICIDPGHYAGVNLISGEEAYGYAEGDFDLKIGLCLQRILLEKYGIESCMTRSTGSISLHGYTDYNLDKGHLDLRGAYAAEQGCDFFIALHTNANLPDANDSPSLLQPIGITKTVVLVNVPCGENETWLAVANSVGVHVSAVNAELGLSDGRPFRCAEVGDIPDWSDEWNDSLTLPGAVLRRLGENGDYYGVLRGAAEAGVPGMIVEHGFHTVAEMRYLAAFGDLAERWGEADADGIAEALGIPPLQP